MAESVIDALIVTLGLDTSNFAKGADQGTAALKKISDRTVEAGKAMAEGTDRGQHQLDISFKKIRDAAATTGKELESRGGQAASFFTKMSGGALGFFSLIAGGDALKGFIQDTMAASAAVGRLATDAGTSTPKMSAWAAVIQQAGGNGGSFQQQMVNMSTALTAQQVNGTFYGGMPYLNRMHISAYGADGKTPRDTADIMVDVAHWMHGHSAPVDQVYGAQLGISQDNIDAMRISGTAGLQANLNNNVTTTQKEADAAAGLQKAEAQLEAQYTAAKNQLFLEFEPQMQKMIGFLQGVDWKGLAAKFGWLTTPPGNPKKDPGFWADVLSGNISGALNDANSDAGGAGKHLHDWVLDLAHYTGSPYSNPLVEHQGGNDGFAPMIRDALGLPGRAAAWARGQFAGASLAPDVASAVNAAATANGIDPNFLRALATTEGGGYDKISASGAIGPMQLMPDTAAGLGVNPVDWQQNVKGGAKYFAQLLKQFNGNYMAAAAAYNAGPNNAGVKYFAQTGDPSRLPQQTQGYIGTIGGDMGAIRMPTMPPPSAARGARPGRASGVGSGGDTINVTINAPSSNPAVLAKAAAAAVQKVIKPKMMAQQSNGLRPY